LQFYPTILIITLLSLILIILFVTHSLKEFYYDRIDNELSINANLFKHLLPDDIIQNDNDRLIKLCIDLGEKTQTRFTIISPKGIVIADSHENPLNMENHADRPEIQDAINGKKGQTSRLSPTLDQRMMYVAIPIKLKDKRVIGVIRTSVSLSAVDEKLLTVYKQILSALIILSFLSAIVIYAISRKISSPIEQIKVYADKIAVGESISSLPPSRIEEIDSLSQKINMMAKELVNRIDTAIEQRNQIETVLSNMKEGLLAIDKDNKILTINQKAVSFLEIKCDNLTGKHFQELIRIPKIHNFIKKVMTTGESLEDEIILSVDKGLFLRLRGTRFQYNKNGDQGVLIVLDDMTKMQKLERVRKDFVANVSHELKTPITSIKGFIETLLDGAIDKPEDALRFLKIIKKHTDRLDSIIDDLLSIARLEQEDIKERIKLELSSINVIINNAIEINLPKAQEKNINIMFKAENDIVATINSFLIEQAIINLIDNAIKYSPPNSDIEVNLLEQKNEIIISIKDYGCGIPEKHQPRLSERFYTVDKSRSRNMGGTGLGLAIVKHIVQLHGGKLVVESQVDEGSIFSIHLKG